jgi:hypothetical protein
MLTRISQPNKRELINEIKDLSESIIELALAGANQDGNVPALEEIPDYVFNAVILALATGGMKGAMIEGWAPDFGTVSK